MRLSVTLRCPGGVGQPPARLRGTMENASTGQMRSSNPPPGCGAGCARVRKSRFEFDFTEKRTLSPPSHGKAHSEGVTLTERRTLDRYPHGKAHSACVPHGKTHSGLSGLIRHGAVMGETQGRRMVPRRPTSSTRNPEEPKSSGRVRPAGCGPCRQKRAWEPEASVLPESPRPMLPCAPTMLILR